MLAPPVITGAIDALPKLVLIVLSLLALGQPLLAQPARTASAPTLVPRVINTYPHDSDAFTQGLIWHQGRLYESAGLYGQSDLRRVELETGQVEARVELSSDVFAEGLELVGDRLIQLTWKAGSAFVYDAETLAHIETIEYQGEGWGLCYDGRYLFMSDGSAYLSIRDANSFALIFRGAVTLDGQLIPPQLLNELECVGEHIYANAWNTAYIFKIDKFTGEIVALIDAASLLGAAERAEWAAGNVLNGIAWNSETDTFYITGKRWSTLYEVEFSES